MSTTLSFTAPFHSDPVTIPNSNNTDNNDTDEEQTYKEMIKQLAAQAPEPYGAIPPLIKKKKKKKKKKEKTNKKEKNKNKKVPPIRRMSHVENWIAVDSKESIPDEEDLRHSSPFRNFLSTDFLVLPLHMPPPSLSATTPEIEEEELPIVKKKLLSKSTPSDLRPIPYPIKKLSPIQVIELDDEDEEDEGEDYDEEEDEEEETEIEEGDDEEEEEEDDDDNTSIRSKRSIPSFSKSQLPSTSTTKSYALSSSPPQSRIEPTRSRWLETIAQLRKSLSRSTFNHNGNDDKEGGGTSGSERESNQQQQLKKLKRKDFIPMPLPPPKRNIRKRRSEATTQPRFNPETNTYTRDTRSNPDHLRMISAELNMMRSRKLSSPLKPRGFLPRRTDSFIRGDSRKLSLLHNQVLFD